MRRGRRNDTVMALRYDADTVASDLARWCEGTVELVAGRPPIVWVPTAYGPRPGLHGDWIVRLAPGDFRPFTPADFAARFSQVGLDDEVLGRLSA